MTKARDLADRTSADLTAVTAGTGISVTNGTGPIPTVTNTVATGFDAKGDLIVGTGADTFSKLTVATTNNWLLTSASSEATGLKWAAPSTSALVFLNGTTLTASTATSINNVFSSTYKHYLIIIEGAVVTNNAAVPYIKLRLSGTDSSTGYNWQTHYGENTTSAAGRVTSSSGGLHTGESNYVSTIQKSIHVVHLTDPGTAVRTVYTAQSGHFNHVFNSVGMHDVATAYDGFSIITAYQFTGTVRTYGYTES